jgi:hypothetical protein
MAGRNKAPSTKRRIEVVYKDNEQWTVLYGELQRRQGRPTLTEHLFRIVGEKLPFEALSKVRKHLIGEGYLSQGVYVAHDSMGCPRYIGRGNIFQRLDARYRAQPPELSWGQVYILTIFQIEFRVKLE